MSSERTFIMVKPDGVKRGVVGETIKRFENRGYKLVALKIVTPSEDLLKKHYAAHVDKSFFPGLLQYMLSGPVVPMVFEGWKAVQVGRSILGATNPVESAPGTIRGDFCQMVGRNLVHGSDSTESAEQEIGLWFSGVELKPYERCDKAWVHE